MTEVMAHNKVALDTVAAGSSVAAITGVVAVVLAILALANVLAPPLVATAVIVLGIGFLIRGGGIAAEYWSLTSAVPERKLLQSQLAAGGGVEVVTGVAGIVLGILALLGIATEMLIPVATIALGAGAVMGSIANFGLGTLEVSYTGARRAASVTRSGAGVQFLVDLAAITLGILALIGVPALNPVTVLVLGVGTTVAGIAAGGAL